MNTQTTSATRIIPFTFFFPVFALFATACAASNDAPSNGSGGEDIETTSALEADATASSDLTKAQSTLILKLLDDVCGDSWCEGAYDWHFPKIVCHFSPGTCTLTFRITDPNPTPQKTYWRSCKVTDLHAFGELVDTAPNGYQSLVDGFYDKVSGCIDHIEDDLRTK